MGAGGPLVGRFTVPQRLYGIRVSTVKWSSSISLLLEPNLPTCEEMFLGYLRGGGGFIFYTAVRGLV
jgi:hypothetical protein